MVLHGDGGEPPRCRRRRRRRRVVCDAEPVAVSAGAHAERRLLRGGVAAHNARVGVGGFPFRKLGRTSDVKRDS